MISRLSKYSNLQQRIIAGAFGAALIIFAAWFSEWTYFLIFLLVCFFTQREFYTLAGLDGILPLKFWGLFTGVCLNVLTFLTVKGILDPHFLYLIVPIGSLTFFVKLYKKDVKKPFTNIAYTYLGVVYVAVPFALLHKAVYHEGVYSYQIVLGLLFLLWASDTGAYFAGTKFGRHKLFERVSPKKSWEGSIGGFLTAMGLALVISQFYLDLRTWEWLALAAIIVVSGTYGDLIESLFKRSIDIKDSGTSIPGHGGFLDRFDGLLLAVPFVLAYLILF